MPALDSLERIYRDALEQSDPAARIAELAKGRPSSDVIVLGKSASSLWNAAARHLDVNRAIVVAPHAYLREMTPHPQLEIHTGGHPLPDAASLRAGGALLEFARTATRPIVALISGGASACAEVPRDGFDLHTLVELNRMMIHGGLPIGRINCVRRWLSTIKGGGLAAAATVPVTTWIESDVSPAHPEDVGSGPTLPNPCTAAEAAAILESLGHPLTTDVARKVERLKAPEVIADASLEILADNATLRDAAAASGRSAGYQVTVLKTQIEGDVAVGAAVLLDAVRGARAGELVVAGGEPVVHVRGDGRGGRCSEMALRLLQHAGNERFSALLAGSDGVDGNSGAAGVAFDTREPPPQEAIERALATSDSFPLMQQCGRAIIMQPTGRNLRDLYLLARH